MVLQKQGLSFSSLSCFFHNATETDCKNGET